MRETLQLLVVIYERLWWPECVDGRVSCLAGFSGLITLCFCASVSLCVCKQNILTVLNQLSYDLGGTDLIISRIAIKVKCHSVTHHLRILFGFKTGWHLSNPSILPYGVGFPFSHLPFFFTRTSVYPCLYGLCLLAFLEKYFYMTAVYALHAFEQIQLHDIRVPVHVEAVRTTIRHMFEQSHRLEVCNVNTT